MSDGVDMTKNFLILFFGISLTSCALFGKNPTEQRKADIYFSQGTQNLINKKYSEALQNLLKANELKKDDSDILNNLGMAYYFKKRPKLAAKYLIRSLKINPKNSDARNNLATIYMQNGKTDLAKKEYEKILGDLIYKKTFRAYYNLGLISLKENNLTQAKEYFTQSVGHRDDYCPAHFELGKIYEKETSYAQALKHFKKSTQNNCKEYSLPYYNLAILNLKLGRDFLAKDYLTKIVNEFPSSPSAKKARSVLKRIEAKKLYRTNNKTLNKNNNSKDYESENF